MRPYIIINGKASNLIDGLLIQSLPPISKPKMRASVEEIDGRDGDQVTPLGFSAYDKQISIGLHGDFNVDDVIEYFNQSGKVTFSNEIDKYYLFSVYEAIDFAKLIRFKTANVTFHVQPFKYWMEEQPIRWTNPGDKTIAAVSVRNIGNYFSRPKLTITGAGVVTVYIDNKQVLQMQLDGTAIIDDFNAVDPEGNYLNRSVTGDYEDIKLDPGVHTVRVTGALESVVVEKYTRWI